MNFNINNNNNIPIITTTTTTTSSSSSNSTLPNLHVDFLEQARSIMNHIQHGGNQTREEDVQGAIRALALLMQSVKLSHGDVVAESLLREGRKMFHDEGTDAERADAMEALFDSSQECLVNGTILQDAFRDGSSVYCRKCSGLVARSRWDAHASMWCPSLPDVDSYDNNQQHLMEDIEMNEDWN
jgi:hypothetical protein